jgi:hypothetical protein
MKSKLTVYEDVTSSPLTTEEVGIWKEIFYVAIKEISCHHATSLKALWVNISQTLWAKRLSLIKKGRNNL